MCRGSAYPCRGGIDFFFVDSADAQTYPCGFRGNDSLGDYETLDISAIDRTAFCTECDWECFRDPSSLFGPVLEGILSPAQLFRRYREDRDFFSFWRQDLAYYRACDWFDGRKDVNRSELESFRPVGTPCGV